MSDSVQPHRWQPTRLPRPWDSPGKNTGVGCHFLLQCMKVKSESEVAQSCPTLSDPMDCSLTRLLRPWDVPGKNTGVGCHFLLQEIFLTQGLNPGLPHCRQMLYCLSHQGSPKASIPTLKPRSTQGPTSSRARHTMQILQQCRNIALSFNI